MHKLNRTIDVACLLKDMPMLNLIQVTKASHNHVVFFVYYVAIILLASCCRLFDLYC